MVRSPKISNSQMCLHEPSPVHQLEFGFYILALVSAAVPALSLCSSDELWLCICLSLQSWRQQFILWPTSLPKYSWWFFSLFSFLLVRIKWWLSSSLHSEQETFDFFFIGEKRVLVTYFLGKMYLPSVVKMKSDVLQKNKTLYELVNYKLILN